jgi:hypothetical protein
VKPILVLLVTALGGCHWDKRDELSHAELLRNVAAISVDATTYSSPPALDTLEEFVDQFPEQVKQQILFIQKQYTRISEKKDQLTCYERFRRMKTNTYVTVPKDSAVHVYGQEPYDTPVYFYQGDSLEGGLPRTLFYGSKNDIELIEEFSYDTAEGSYAETKEYYFSETSSPQRGLADISSSKRIAKVCDRSGF